MDEEIVLRRVRWSLVSQLVPVDGRLEPLTAMLLAMRHCLVLRPRIRRIAIRLLDHRVRGTALPPQFAHDHSIGLGTVHSLHAPKTPRSEVVGITESTRVLVGIGHRPLVSRRMSLRHRGSLRRKHRTGISGARRQ